MVYTVSDIQVCAKQTSVTPTCGAKVPHIMLHISSSNLGLDLKDIFRVYILVQQNTRLGNLDKIFKIITPNFPAELQSVHQYSIYPRNWIQNRVLG